VKIAGAQILALSAFEEIAGTVTARNRAEIATKIQARVEAIPVRLGSHVGKGDVLAELDMRDIQARQTQAQAVSDQTSQDLKRYDQLLERKLISQQEYDRIKSQADIAQANLSEARAMFSYARVVAPFAGTVTQKMADLGDLTVPGQPLFTIEEDANLRLVVSIPESRQNRIKIGDSLIVAVPSIDTALTGMVAEMSNGADPASRSFEAKISLPAVAGLRAGQYGRLQVPADSASGLFVPTSAIIRRGQLELAYAVSDSGKAALRLIRTGRTIGDNTEVLSGLSPQERVIVEPGTITEGDRVKELP
jgi:membrane fusion protein, multidrug efflux system